MKRAFVIGDPIKHSRSPKIHNFWIKKYGLDAHYEALHIKRENLPDFMKKLRNGEFSGGNVTLPHKENIADFVDEVSQAAKAIGAANTLVWDDASATLMADNTDAYGFTANLDAQAPQWRNGNHAVVLGAGGAARAIIHALVNIGYKTINITNRTKTKAEALCAMEPRICSAIDWEDRQSISQIADLLVNTTALGMAGQPSLDMSLQDVKSTLIVSDIVYVPLETNILAQARQMNLAAVDGLGMLLHQAVPGFEKWFGVRPVVDQALRDLIVADLMGHEL